MATYLHPGVYVQELPGPQQITAASTSNTVFIGAAETGPCNTPTLVTSWNQYLAAFGGLVWGAPMPLAVYAFFAEGGAVCYVVRTEAAPAQSSASLTVGPLLITAAAPGAWGDSLAVTLTQTGPAFALNVLYSAPGPGAAPTVLDQIAAAYAAANGLPTQTLAGQSWYPVESFPGFSAVDLQGQGGGPPAIESRINATSLFIRVAVSGAAPPAAQTQPAALWGGAGDPAPTSAQLAAALATLDPLTGISLLCVPDTVLIQSPTLQKAAVQQALTYGEGRPHTDLFCILDPPFGLSVADILAFKTGAASADGVIPSGQALQSPYGALYYPWLTVQYPQSGMILPMAPGGAMAGRYANVDATVGPWQAPAGIINGGLSMATGVMTPVTDTDQDSLNPAGVNAIRSLVNYGICAYGARTLSPDPDQIYIGVRRLLTMIEVSLYSSLQWVVFEPNTTQLWASVTRDVTAFLTNLWQAGALFGATSAEAFHVICDASNNPPEVQTQGQLFIDIMVAPTYPAEFIAIRIQMATLATS